jgi:hypothetical protein
LGVSCQGESKTTQKYNRPKKSRSRVKNDLLTALTDLHKGRQKKIKRENDVHLRQLAKKSTYVPSFFSFFFTAFLGVSRQGEFENTRKKIEYVSKKSPGKYFFGGDFFAG